MGNDFDIDDFLKNRENPEFYETVKSIVKTFSQSQFMASKNMFQGLKKKMKKIFKPDYSDIEEKYLKLLMKDEETIKKFKENRLSKKHPELEGDEKETVFE